jgi:hypothetical protein
MADQTVSAADGQTIRNSIDNALKGKARMVLANERAIDVLPPGVLERQAFGKTAALREVLDLAARRLSPGDNYVGDAAAEITVLRQAAERVPVADARTEILKAIAVLRDRVGRASSIRASCAFLC